MREQVISCCGVVCSECGYYPKDCQGCMKQEGKVFWLEFTGGDVCDIYNCCTHEKKMKHCGQCNEVPCTFFHHTDPTKSEEENNEILKKQLEILRMIN